jgi:hypothetical protein
MISKAMGKKELEELGCNFVVANVPAFAAINDPYKVNRMKIYSFKSTDEIKEFVKKETPLVVFDQSGVYKEKSDMESNDGSCYYVRCCKLESKEFECLRANLRESETLNFSFKFDFSNWFGGKI